MIDLYHKGMSVCAAKVGFALGEKKIAWESRYVDIHKGDQFAPDYVKLNPKAVVPTLVHDGHVVVESTQLVTMGFDTPGLGEKYRLYNSYLAKMEKALAQRAWLAADTFSLADIAMTPYVNRLDMLGMSQMWEETRPRVTEWFERIKARSAFKPALLDRCPPHLTTDMITYGRESWPNVERLLAQAS